MKDVGLFKSKKIFYCRHCGLKFYKTKESHHHGNYCCMKCYYKSCVDSVYCVVCGKNITNKIHLYIDNRWDIIKSWNWKTFIYTVNFYMVKNICLCDNCMYNTKMIGLHASCMRKRRMKYYNKNLTKG